MSRRSSGPSDPPKNYTRNGSRGLVNIILTILLIFFNITTLITAILTAIAAAQDLCPTPCFTVQSVVSFISWLAISLLFVSVIRMGTRHGHRLARYIFRVVLTILIVLVAARILVPACEGLTTFCDVADWFIVANLIVGALVILISAIFDIPHPHPYESQGPPPLRPRLSGSAPSPGNASYQENEQTSIA